ncbi:MULTISPECIES: hypothetical protein [Aphanothece]|uniref:hypothetical protein n=1 Tax=Aphanothece TaxID=1121 RepID=UPI003984F3FD
MTDATTAVSDAVLHDWFAAIEPRPWFGSDPDVDRRLRDRFLPLARQARRQFWLMPRMHSETLAIRERAIPLVEGFTDPRTATPASLGPRRPRSWPSCRPPAPASEGGHT